MWWDWLITRDVKDVIVARDMVFHVSVYTQFEGTDYNLGGGKVEIFATYLTGLGYICSPVKRYSTWKEAVAGHKKIKKDVFHRCNTGRVSDAKDQMVF